MSDESVYEHSNIQIPLRGFRNALVKRSQEAFGYSFRDTCILLDHRLYRECKAKYRNVILFSNKLDEEMMKFSVMRSIPYFFEMDINNLVYFIIN